MNNQEQKKTIKELVLEKIKKGEIKMESKKHFVFKTGLLILGTIIIFLFVLYLLSFIFFFLRASGLWFMPRFGLPGAMPFLISSPWLLIFIVIIFIFVLEMFSKRFSFVYRRPVLFSMLAILIFVLFGTFIIGKARLHPILFQRAQERPFSMAGRIYNNRNFQVENIHRGTVTEITDEGFQIKKPDDSLFNVIIDEKTRLVPGQNIQKDDAVVIMGQEKEGIIRALDIRKIPNNEHLPFLRNEKKHDI